MKRQLESSSLRGRRCQKLPGRGRDGRATSQHHHSATSVLQRRQVNDSPHTIGEERRRPILPAACTASAHDLLGIVVSYRPRPLIRRPRPSLLALKREAGGGRRGSDPGPGVGRVHARGGFLPRHDEDLREPLVRRQGSQVSMRVARGSASWLSSHGGV